MIQAIVGKGQPEHIDLPNCCINRNLGLYEQYKQRQIAGEAHAGTNVARSANYARSRQTQGLPHASSSDLSHTSCIRSDAINTPQTGLHGPSSALFMPSLKDRSTSAPISKRYLRLKHTEAGLMPGYNVVHNHCARITADLESDDSTIMQSYEYGPLDIGPAIGFQVPTTHCQVRAPLRKVTALEKLPPLSPEVAAEIARQAKARKQAEILAAIRNAREKDSKRQRRANRTMQTRLPPYPAHSLVTCSAKDLEAIFQSEPSPKTSPTTKNKQFRI